MDNKLLAANRHLSKADSVIKKLIIEHGPCKLYDNNSLINQPKFHVLAWAIINQQLSVKSALSIENKLLHKLSSKTIKPQQILSLSDKSLSACGLSKQKIRYLRTMSEAVINDKTLLEALSHEGDEAVISTLTSYVGIGPWTADMFLMFSLGRMDVLPLGDLALRKSIALHYNLGEQPTLNDYHSVTNAWKPYRTIASWYLWAAVD